MSRISSNYRSEDLRRTVGTNEHGMFGQTGFLSVGDPYESHKPSKSKKLVGCETRQFGKGFVTGSRTKKGLHLFGTFSPYVPHAAGEYTTPELGLRTENKEKRIARDDFKPGGTSKKSSGLGSAFGTFDAYPERLDPKTRPPPKKRSSAAQHAKPFIPSSTPKFSKSGYAGGTISGKGPKYISDPYTEPTSASVSYKNSGDVDKPPMRVGNHPATFDAQKATGASSVHKLDPKAEKALEKAERKKQRAAARSKGKAVGGTWKLSNTVSRDFGKFPKHEPDPYNTRQRFNRTSSSANGPRSLAGRPEFRTPSMGTKSTPTPSVLLMSSRF